MEVSCNSPVASVFLYGPTGSGKSALAMKIVEKYGSSILNADALQVYAGLEILTDRPPDKVLNSAAHHLYGHVDPSHRYSVGEWLSDMERQRSHLISKSAVVVGGTGLYFKSLEDGLASIPEIEPGVLAHWDQRVRSASSSVRAELAGRYGLDLSGSGHFLLTDTQRLARELAIISTTGRALAGYRIRSATVPRYNPAIRMVLNVDRADLYAKIEQRVRQMMVRGAVEEVRRFLLRSLDPGLPAMKAIGVRSLRTHLQGEFTLEQAIEDVQKHSRRLAKRQLTWARNQFPHWTWISGHAEGMARVSEAFDQRS